LFDDDKLINYITTRTVLWLVRRTDARQYKNYYKQTNTHTRTNECLDEGIKQDGLSSEVRSQIILLLLLVSNVRISGV